MHKIKERQLLNLVKSQHVLRLRKLVLMIVYKNWVIVIGGIGMPQAPEGFSNHHLVVALLLLFCCYFFIEPSNHTLSL